MIQRVAADDAFEAKTIGFDDEICVSLRMGADGSQHGTPDGWQESGQTEANTLHESVSRCRLSYPVRRS